MNTNKKTILLIITSLLVLGLLVISLFYSRSKNTTQEDITPSVDDSSFSDTLLTSTTTQKATEDISIKSFESLLFSQKTKLEGNNTFTLSDLEDESGRYTVMYSKDTDEMFIQIDDYNVKEARKVLEKKLEQLFKSNKKTLCDKKILITASKTSDPGYQGGLIGLSFCPDGLPLDPQRPVEEF